jgi:hypothetical protein
MQDIPRRLCYKFRVRVKVRVRVRVRVRAYFLLSEHVLSN